MGNGEAKGMTHGMTHGYELKGGMLEVGEWCRAEGNKGEK